MELLFRGFIERNHNIWIIKFSCFYIINTELYIIESIIHININNNLLNNHNPIKIKQKKIMKHEKKSF